jgi:hypothetical protein
MNSASGYFSGTTKFYRAGILEQSMGVRNRVNRVVVPALQAKQVGGIDSLESSPGLLKSLKMKSLFARIKQLKVNLGQKVLNMRINAQSHAVLVCQMHI